MRTTLRNVTWLVGIAFTVQGLAWIVAPARAAASLGMPVLGGLGRSSQFGDLASFFLTLGIGTLAGNQPGRGRVLYFPAALLGGAALCRTIAWAAHGAPFATLFIAVEIACCVILLARAQHTENE